ncbi:MAG: Mur ligase domain-containing protein, partial [Bacteroidaceae bacterium]
MAVLADLLKNVKVIGINGNPDVEINGMELDSRQVKPGGLFFAVKGTVTDGHKFIPKALENGAV